MTFLVAGAVLVGVWIALVGQADLQDNVAGLIAGTVSLVVGWVVSVRGRAVPQFRAGDLRRIAVLAPHLVSETASVYAATWRRARGRGAPSGYRTVHTDVGGGGWASARRSGVVVALLSFTPAAVVIDVDPESGDAVVHDFAARTDR